MKGLRSVCVKLTYHTREFARSNELSCIAVTSTRDRCGGKMRALRAHQDFQERRRPSPYTFVDALIDCGKDLESCKRIHADIIASGLGSDVLVGTTLVDVYCKCGSLVHARGVFEKMPCRNVASWNAMIRGYTHMQEGELAWETYVEMQQEGVVPDGQTFVAALKACSTLITSKECIQGVVKGMIGRCLHRIRSIHVDVMKRGLETNLFVGTTLTDLYSKSRSLEDARLVFDKMPHRDVVSWNVMILGYAQMEHGRLALGMYARMQQEGVVPTRRTFVAALKACSSLATFEGSEVHETHDRAWYLEQVRVLHAEVVKSGYDSDVFVGTMLVDAYAKWGQLTDARLVFDKMTHRNVVSWTAMILGYAHSGEGEKALQMYRQMLQENVALDERTIVAALKACSSLVSKEVHKDADEKYFKNRCLDEVRGIHLAAIKMEYDSDMFVGSLLVDVYAKCGSLIDARHVFDKMQHRNVVTWNAMIFGYAQMEHGDMALQLYGRMLQEGPPPDDLTCIAALKACGSAAALDKGEEIKARIFSGGPQALSTRVGTALIDLYAKCGSMRRAHEVFEALSTRTIATWNAMIAGYARQGDCNLVFLLCERMTQDGLQPDGITFLCLLTLCSHVGLVDTGQRYFVSMITDYGIIPTIEHYSCLVDILARAGQLSKAMEVVSAMPFEPSGNIWRSLLGACQKWRNVELGRLALQRAKLSDENDAALCVLMSNIYAAADMPEDAKEMQALRAKISPWKNPGHCRWTDPGGVAHEFLVGDRQHPESRHIHEKLRFLSSMLEEDIQLRFGYTIEHQEAS